MKRFVYLMIITIVLLPISCVYYAPANGTAGHSKTALNGDNTSDSNGGDHTSDSSGGDSGNSGNVSGSTTTTTVVERTASAGTVMIWNEECLAIMNAVREQITPAANEAVLYYYRPDGSYDDWTLWMWADGGDGNDNFENIQAKGFSTADVVYNEKNHTVGYMKFNKAGTESNGCIPLTGDCLDVIKNDGVFNFIVRKKGNIDNWTKDYPLNLKWNLSFSKNFGTVSGEGVVYEVGPNPKPVLQEAAFYDGNKIMLALSPHYAIEIGADKDNGFVVKSAGSQVSVINMSCSPDSLYSQYNEGGIIYEYTNCADKLIIEVGNMANYNDLYISHPDFYPSEGIKVNASIKNKAVVSSMKYNGNDLGITISGSTADFKVYAPLASTVNVLLYSDWRHASADIDNVSGNQTLTDSLTNGGMRVSMTQAGASTGVWQASNVNISGKHYYLYELQNLDKVYRVCDINALVASPDSIAAQIIDINDAVCKPTGWEAEYTNPFGAGGTQTKTYTESVIYEMHICDWAKGLDPSNEGKFDEITEALGTNGDGTLGRHLKDLGITHVQLLPISDSDLPNNDTGYSLGYGSYHYNVPEGRYVNNHGDGGYEAVKQTRAMIKAFHDAGIAVNIAVAYSHTSGTNTNSLYDMTVPYYYYRLDYGKYSNGSGWGNETDSSMPMYRKYMIDSLSHWMNDYHINGFCFEYMGLHETETMSEIYTALSEIDKNVMVYGEPWEGWTTSFKNGVTQAGKVGDGGYGAFDDDFRNAIKGSELSTITKGHVQGNFSDAAVSKGLCGWSRRNYTDGYADLLLQLHYVESCWNYTLFDKLDISILGEEYVNTDNAENVWKPYDELTSEQKETVKAQNKLAAAYIILAQGTPFIAGGQEFMRTKHGRIDYYSAAYNNVIDMSFKTKFADVYNVYKGLIALRRTYDAFTAGKNVAAPMPAEGVTKYTVEGTNGDFCVYFNATSSDVTMDTTGYTTAIDIRDGTIQESATIPTKVGATNFVVLKK